MMFLRERGGHFVPIRFIIECVEAKGMKAGIKEGVRKERIAAIERMIKAGSSKEQIISYGYTKEE